jgi:ribosomal protein S18 acetylase RimI-like enzyme
MIYSLRQATAGDFEFLFELRRATLREYVEAIWGWDDADQLERFRTRFEPARIDIVVADGRDAGYLQLTWWPEHAYVDALFIRPEFQRRGLGTAILHDIQRQASARGLPVRLQVLVTNPARHLYERLGFRTVEEGPTHVAMMWTPDGGDRNEGAPA